jgi:hypothetical protein
MPASGVVEVDDPGGDLDSGFSTGAEVLAVDVFNLECGVQRLGGWVVQGRADPMSAVT